jgi:hypothetical protein
MAFGTDSLRQFAALARAPDVLGRGTRDRHRQRERCR